MDGFSVVCSICGEYASLSNNKISNTIEPVKIDLGDSDYSIIIICTSCGNEIREM